MNRILRFIIIIIIEQPSNADVDWAKVADFILIARALKINDFKEKKKEKGGGGFVCACE